MELTKKGLEGGDFVRRFNQINEGPFFTVSSVAEELSSRFVGAVAAENLVRSRQDVGTKFS